MRLRPKTFTVEQLLTKITSNTLDLQPDFQRGEVWTEIKKRRLVDTIVRNWYVPAIHLVELPNSGLEVLDGQQRLLAIRDFVSGHLRIDGTMPPHSSTIAGLHDSTFESLPGRIRSRILHFKIRALILFQYLPEEPGELFFRLNQLTGLTPAEQRNAFYGTARLQVKQIVATHSTDLFSQEISGFSNTRMGHDDVVARLCFALDVGTHHRKVTAKAIEEQYRSREGFPRRAVARAKSAIALFAQSAPCFKGEAKFNKATLLSWFCFVAEVEKAVPTVLTPKLLGDFVRSFEVRRNAAKLGEAVDPLVLVFNDRASSRVADVTSVLVRDFVLWFYWVAFCRENSVTLPLSKDHLNAIKDIASAISPPPPDVDLEAESRLMATFEKHRWGASV